MNAIAINGSPRKGGNTSILLKMVLKELEAEGIETELIEMAGKDIHGCIACYGCFKNRNGRCAVEKDFANTCIEKMHEADVIILGSPTYFANVTTEMKALIDRAGLVGKANDDCFKRKLGAAVVAVRRGGQIHTFNSINHFFLIGQMIVVGSSYWNHGIGRDIGEVKEDAEGVQIMDNLGKNIAWLLKKMKD